MLVDDTTVVGVNVTLVPVDVDEVVVPVVDGGLVTRVDVPKTRKHDTNGHFRTIIVKLKCQLATADL